MRSNAFKPLLTLASLVLMLFVLSWSIDSVAALQQEKQSPKPPNSSKEDEPIPVTERHNLPQQPQHNQLGPRQFGTFHLPQINNRGDVAFIGRYQISSQANDTGQGVFIKTAEGQWKYIRNGDLAGNLNDKIHSFGSFNMNANSEISMIAAFGAKTSLQPEQANADAEAASGTSDRNLGIFIKTDREFTNLLRLGLEVPNMPSRFSNFGNPSMNSKGAIAFIGTYVDPDGRGLFISEGGKLQIAARSGQKIARNETAVFSEHYYTSRINERGEVAFLSHVGSGSGIFVLRATGIELIALNGRPSPVKGTKYLGFGNRTPSINDKGEVAYVGFYDGPNAGRALFYKGEGPAKLVLSSRDKNPKYAFTDFNHPAINNRGDILFTGRMEGRNYGIFIKTAKGIEPIAVTGQLAPGMKEGEEFNNFATQPSFNDKGDVVFYAQLKNANVGIFIKDEKGLRPLVMRGDKLPFNPE